MGQYLNKSLLHQSVHSESKSVLHQSVHSESKSVLHQSVHSESKMGQSEIVLHQAAASVLNETFANSCNVRLYYFEDLIASEEVTIPDGADFTVRKRSDGSVVAQYCSNRNFKLVGREECTIRAQQHSRMWQRGKNVERSVKTQPAGQKVVISGHRVPAGGPGVLGVYVQPPSAAQEVNSTAARLAELEYMALPRLFAGTTTKMTKLVQHLRAAGGDCAAPVIGITPFTAKSVTRNYTSYSHQDPGDSEFTYIWWYHKVAQGDQLADPGYFYLACEQLAAGAEGGLRFRPANGSVLYLNTNLVWHHSQAPASTDSTTAAVTAAASNRPQRKRRAEATAEYISSDAAPSNSSSNINNTQQLAAADGIYGSALFLKPAVFKAYGNVHQSVVVKHLYQQKKDCKAARAANEKQGKTSKQSPETNK